MKQFVVLAGVLALVPLIALAGDQALFQYSIKDGPVENGKALDMEFQEIERNTESSTVRITRRSGGSVSSSMFVLQGMCGLARARSAQYFIPNRVVGDERGLYAVTFPDLPPEPGKGFTMAQCELLRY